MIDLSMSYLGLKLKNPIVASSSPLTAYIDNIKRMEEAGVAAVILPSLFEEQVEKQGLGPMDKKSLPHGLQHIPDMEEYNRGASGYLAHIYQAKRAVKIPIIASLNGYYGGGWVQYARLLEAAGADALELNIYYMATKPHVTGDDVEQMYMGLVRDVKKAVNIPVAIKLSPYFSAMANMATRLDKAGADGLVLFNRFYQPDFDLEERVVVSSLDLSSSVELRLRLRWVAILYDLVQADFGITGGVHTAEDVLKSVMAGAKVVMMASAFLAHGVEQVTSVLSDMESWLAAHEVESMASLLGTMSQKTVGDQTAFERANYMNVLSSLKPGDE